MLSVMMQSFFMLCMVSVQWVLFGYSPLSGRIHRTLHRQPFMVRLPRRDHGAGRRLCRHDPAHAFCHIPDDVRRHNSGAHHRRFRGKNEIRELCDFQPFVGHVCLRSRSAIGYGEAADGSNAWRPRFRRRGGRAYLLGNVRARLRAHARKKKNGIRQEPVPPHNMTYTLLGASLLWFGWFGFNAGSALGANGSRSRHLSPPIRRRPWPRSSGSHRVVRGRETDRARRRDRCGGRTCGHYPGIRLRRPALRS